jgi:hypothetical protein
MTMPPSLAHQTADRLAVVEALYRFAAGIDKRDRDLLASSLAPDAVSDFRPAAAKAGFEYPVIEGRDTIVSALSTSLVRSTRPTRSPTPWSPSMETRHVSMPSWKPSMCQGAITAGTT